MRSFARAYRSVWAVSIGTPRFPYHGGVAIDGAWSKGRIEEGSIPVVLNLLALASANSHQFHGSVASDGGLRERFAGPGPLAGGRGSASLPGWRERP